MPSLHQTNGLLSSCQHWVSPDNFVNPAVRVVYMTCYVHSMQLLVAACGKRTKSPLDKMPPILGQNAP